MLVTCKWKGCRHLCRRGPDWPRRLLPVLQCHMEDPFYLWPRSPRAAADLHQPKIGNFIELKHRFWGRKTLAAPIAADFVAADPIDSNLAPISFPNSIGAFTRFVSVTCWTQQPIESENVIAPPQLVENVAPNSNWTGPTRWNLATMAPITSI